MAEVAPLAIVLGMNRYAWLVPLMAITIWPEVASAQWRWIVEHDRFDDAKPASCAAVQDFANGRIVALPKNEPTEQESLLVLLDSVPQFEIAAANSHAVNLQGCNLPARSIESRRRCLETYSGALRQASSLMRVAKEPVRKSQSFRYEASKGASFIVGDGLLKELTPSGVLMSRLRFENFETFDDSPADPRYVADLDIPFVDIPTGLAMTKRPCK